MFPAAGKESLDEFQRVCAKVNADLARFKKSPLPQLFRFVPIWLVGLILLGVAVADPVLQHFGNHTITHQHAVIALVGLAVVVMVYVIGLRVAAPLARMIAGDFNRARRLLETSSGKRRPFVTNRSYGPDRAGNFNRQNSRSIWEWKRVTKEIARRHSDRPVDLDDRFAQLNQKNDEFHRTELQRIQQAHEEVVARSRQESQGHTGQFAEARKARLALLEKNRQDALKEMS